MPLKSIPLKFLSEEPLPFHRWFVFVNRQRFQYSGDFDLVFGKFSHLSFRRVWLTAELGESNGAEPNGSDNEDDHSFNKGQHHAQQAQDEGQNHRSNGSFHGRAAFAISEQPVANPRADSDPTKHGAGHQSQQHQQDDWET